MDTFPYPKKLKVGSSARVLAGIGARRTYDGVLNVTQGYHQLQYDLTLLFRNLYIAELQILEEFVESHLGREVRVEWPGTGRVYAAKLLDYEEPQEREGHLWDFVVKASGPRI